MQIFTFLLFADFFCFANRESAQLSKITCTLDIVKVAGVHTCLHFSLPDDFVSVLLE